MKTTEKFICPHCGKEIEAEKINQWKAGQLGRVSSEKKTLAARENAKKPRPRNKSKNDFELDVTKNGKPCKLRLVNDGGKQYHLYTVYPDGQQVRARYQPKVNGGFPDIKFLAVKNGFEVVNE